MKTEQLIFLYKVIVFVGFFLVFFGCYYYGWYYDKRYRFATKRERLSGKRKIIHHFRGIPGSSPQIHSIICVRFQSASFPALICTHLVFAARFFHQNEDKILYLKILMIIMAAFMITSIAVMIYLRTLIRKRAAFAQDYFGIKLNKYKELDRIFLGVENLEGWTPEKAENSPIPEDLPKWFKNVIDLNNIMGVDLHKQTHTVKTPTFNLNESNPVQEIYADKHDKSGKVQSLVNGKRTLKSTPLLGGDTYVPAINDTGEKYDSVKKTNEFSKEMNIQQGKAALKDMARQTLEAEFFVQSSASSKGMENLESLSQGFHELQMKESSIGSASTKIHEHIEELNPENKINVEP